METYDTCDCDKVQIGDKKFCHSLLQNVTIFERTVKNELNAENMNDTVKEYIKSVNIRV